MILGESNQLGTLPQWGSFISDSWRWKPNLTINAGVRYDVQLPFYAQNNSYSTATIDDIFGVTGAGSGFDPGSTVTGLGNLFKPGTLQGTATTYKMLEKGKRAYNTDWSNVAPSIGAAWTVGADEGFLHDAARRATGDSVLRAGYSIAYQRGGMSDFTGVYGSNPGVSDRRLAQPDQRQPRHAPGAADRRRPERAGHQPHAHLPDGGADGEFERLHVRPEHQDAERLRRSRSGWQRKLAKNMASRRATSTRTATTPGRRAASCR